MIDGDSKSWKISWDFMTSEWDLMEFEWDLTKKTRD